MTDNVKGAGRRAAARKKTAVARNEQRLEELKRDEESGKVVRGKAKSNARKTAEAMAEAIENRAKKTATKKVAQRPPTVEGSGEPLWEASATLGSNVDRLKTAGVTWRRIAEMANANGIEMPWPDGGKLLRARKQFLDGSEGKPRPERKRSAARRSVSPDDERPYSEQRDERLREALAHQNVPWQEQGVEAFEDEQLLEMLDGKRITFVSSVTGFEQTVRAVKNSKHCKIKHGKEGPYFDFVTVEGPFMAISLSRMIGVSN